MRDSLRSLRLKLSAAMLILLIAEATANVLLFIWLFNRTFAQSMQLLYIDLATQVAHDIEPALTPVIDFRRIQHTVLGVRQKLPFVDIYIVGTDGTVEYGFSSEFNQAKKISLEPIDTVLRSSGMASFPIYGENPANYREPKPISVAAFMSGGKKYFVYITLPGKFGQLFETVTAENALLGLGIFVLVATIVIMALFGTLVFSLLTKRLRILVSLVRSYSKSDFSRRFPPAGNDEIDEVGAALNQMSEEIEKGINALRERDQRRRELIADVSHDIGTPLQLISGYTELLLSARNESEASRAEYCGAIHRCCQSLNLLLQQLAELSKLENFETTPLIDEFSLNELIDELFVLYLPQTAERGITLALATDDPALHVYADRSMIERVFSNLLTNALRHTPDGGRIVVSLTKTSQSVRVEVTDTGSGIPADALDKVFDKFYQVGGPTKGASGLGLSIVRQLLHSHGSSVTATSAPDRGSSFSFELPRAEIAIAHAG